MEGVVPHDERKSEGRDHGGERMRTCAFGFCKLTEFADAESAEDGHENREGESARQYQEHEEWDGDKGDEYSGDEIAHGGMVMGCDGRSKDTRHGEHDEEAGCCAHVPGGSRDVRENFCLRF